MAKSWTPGTRYSRERRKLYRFGRGRVQVIRAWPNPAAWAKRDDSPWRGLRPWVDLSAASELHTAITWTGQQEAEAYREIPQPLLQAAVAAHLERKQWSSLQLAARVPGGLELLGEVPVLGASLACAHLLRPEPVARPLRSARALLKYGGGMRTWRRVAGWLGLEDSRCLVDTLRRVVVTPERPWPHPMLVDLQSAWRVPFARKRLLHADQLGLDGVALVITAWRNQQLAALHPNLVAAAFNAGRETSVPAHFAQVAAAWSELRPGRTLPTLRTAEALDTLREELRQELNDRFRPARPSDELIEFPPPPLLPLPAMHALASPAALQVESAEMNNCLHLDYWATWTRRRLGYGYALDVNGERADVWIVPARQGLPGEFQLQEVRGPGNAPPPVGCLGVVDAWLAEHRRRLQASAIPLSVLPDAWQAVWAARLEGIESRFPTGLEWADDEIPF